MPDRSIAELIAAVPPSPQIAELEAESLSQKSWSSNMFQPRTAFRASSISGVQSGQREGVKLPRRRPSRSRTPCGNI